MSLKDEYVARMVSHFKRWDARFDMLKARTDELEEPARSECDAQLRSLYTARNAAYARLQQVRSAGESGWRLKQSEIDNAWLAMTGSLEQASARIRKAE